jgi:uncharacterized membrane protein
MRDALGFERVGGGGVMVSLVGDVRGRLRAFGAQDVALTAVFSALMAATTYFAVPLPFGGLMHFGNTVMWVASILFGGLIGGLAGGIGGMIVDLLLAPIWAPFTVFCKLASGLAAGLVSGEVRSVNRSATARVVLGVISGALVNWLAYAPVYYLLLGPGATVLWLWEFVSPVALITYVVTVIVALAVMRAYPRAMSYKSSIRDRVRASRKG